MHNYVRVGLIQLACIALVDCYLSVVDIICVSKKTKSSTLISCLHIQGKSCSYFYKVQQKLNGQVKLREYGLKSAWDIEDLVDLGKKIKVHVFSCSVCWNI